MEEKQLPESDPAILSEIPGGVSEKGRIKARFELLVRLRDKEPSNFPNKQRYWCYRGDKFTSDAPKMLINLINHLKKSHGRYKLMELYDNSLPRNDEDRKVIRISDGVVENNVLHKYAEMLTSYSLPEFLRK